MHLDIPHSFSASEAKSRIEKVLIEARAKVGEKVIIQEERWDGDTLHFDLSAEGQRITGTLTVKDKEFLVDAQLPMMLRLFEGQIEKAAKEQVAKMLAASGSQSAQSVAQYGI